MNIQYAAGLFDGEGSVSTKWPSRWQCVLEIKMCHKPTIEKFSQIVGGDVKKAYEHRRGRRTQWRIRYTDNEAVRVAKLLSEHCCEKRSQLEALVEFKKHKDPSEREKYANIITAEKRLEFF